MGTLVCKVELSKTTGIKVTVVNDDAKITQTFHLDGTKITTEVEHKPDGGPVKKSTITQNSTTLKFEVAEGTDKISKYTQMAESVKVEVKAFTVEAETITCKSTKATSHKSDDTFGIESTKAMTVKSSDVLTVESTKDSTYKSSAKVNIEATADLTAKGAKANIEATGDLKLKGLKAEMKGDAGVTLDSAKIDIKGQMNTVSGSMIKLG